MQSGIVLGLPSTTPLSKSPTSTPALSFPPTPSLPLLETSSLTPWFTRMTTNIRDPIVNPGNERSSSGGEKEIAVLDLFERRRRSGGVLHGGGGVHGRMWEGAAGRVEGREEGEEKRGWREGIERSREGGSREEEGGRLGKQEQERAKRQEKEEKLPVLFPINISQRHPRSSTPPTPLPPSASYPLPLPAHSPTTAQPQPSPAAHPNARSARTATILSPLSSTYLFSSPPPPPLLHLPHIRLGLVLYPLQSSSPGSLLLRSPLSIPGSHLSSQSPSDSIRPPSFPRTFLQTSWLTHEDFNLNKR